MNEQEEKALPIKCRNLCIHYTKCKPFTNPVFCNKIELRDHVKQAIEQAGYVKLADDQSLPEPSAESASYDNAAKNMGAWTQRACFMLAHKDLYDAGWRKVEI